MKKMKNVAIITARGGSKRIPRKNIKAFLGKPIIAYSIEAAINSGLFNEVMVSTDDEEIAKVSRQYGAKIPFMRSGETSNDFAITAEVIDEVIKEYQKREINFEAICCILPTAPLIKIENLKRGFELLVEKNADIIIPIVKFHYPIQRALKMTDGKIEMFYPEFYKSRSQDLEPGYHDAAQFYWMKFDTGLNGENKYGFELNGILVQDIDTDEDWKLAELKYKLLNEQEK